ncbi:helix-turn-helix domain-containing protein [Nocardia sp. NPDC050710]|uniref:helix-turn-helix domain-containing protein n=1 Tax=Nocardia sp. NPDC050710 TaxID=3157220 RepID=UPI0033E0A9D6
MEFEAREDRKPQGRKKFDRERAAYLQLVQQGYSNTQACAVVGARNMGDRAGPCHWSNGWPIAAVHLQVLEIDYAVTRYQNGESLTQIGQHLGVAHTTIRTALQRRGVPRRDSHGRQ